jgi:hypothetical protein
MHDGDKIGQSAVGGLIRSRLKVQINPFPEGQELMKKAHKLGTYFSYGNRHAQLMTFRLQVKDQPELKIKVDLNTTRVAAQHGLLNSELKLNRLLRLYMTVHNDAPQLTSSEWDTIAEVEGILNISKDLTTLMQFENLYNGAFGQIIKHVTLKRLRSDFIPVIDMQNVSNAKVSTPINDIIMG